MKKFINFDITQYNSYRIQSEVAMALFPENKQDIVDVIEDYKDAIIVGSGNNIILSKSRYENTFVFLRDSFFDCRIEGNRVVVSSGMSMRDLSKIVAENSLRGVETFIDIPGSVGGGVTMNAGAGEQFISDFITQVEAYDTSKKQFVVFTKESCNFGYRNSIFKNCKNLIITQVSFELETAAKESILAQMTCIKQTRESKQPKEFPNAGSVFKRPQGHFVGTMIQELGLKGYSIGGAQISEKHAGFIVNRGGATGEDIIRLINFVRERVRERFGVELELEQIII